MKPLHQRKTQKMSEQPTPEPKSKPAAGKDSNSGGQFPTFRKPPPKPPEIKLGRPLPDVTLREEFAETARAQAAKVALTAKVKVHLFIGRGRTGKTTNIRYHAANLIKARRNIIVLDADRTNPVLAQYLNDIGMPENYTDNAIATFILETIVEAVPAGYHVLIDFGGGDTSLYNIIREMPDFIPRIQELGGAVIANYAIGASVDYLAPLSTLWSLGFRPTATAFLFNEASTGALQPSTFASIKEHSFYRDLSAKHNAVSILIPRLGIADIIESHRLNFVEAASIATAERPNPLTLFQQMMMRGWLTNMEKAYEPIAGWYK